MNKKSLIILIINLIIVLAVLTAGFFVFEYLKQKKSALQGSIGQENIENNAEQPPENPKVETGKPTGLFICADKCGDGICQESNDECKDNMNCVCPESKEECSADCQ